MLTVILMVIGTAASIFFLIESGKASRISVAEIVVSKAWTNKFARLQIEEKKEDFLRKNGRYHTVSEKKAAKKVKAWDKEIAEYKKNEDAYMSGRKFSLLDIIPLFGYQFLVDIKIDGNSDMMRSLTQSCERTGYLELERSMETNDKKNSAIYAYYLLASLFSYLFVGVILACVLGVMMVALESESVSVMMVMAVGFVGPVLAGYIPYDSIQSRANKRQEEIDSDFPNAISKIALLVTAGMNISNAIEETAMSGDSLIYRELRIVLHDLSSAATVSGAFSRMQSRCSNKYLDKMVTIITKSYVSGNMNLADDLKAINDECWLDRKHNARRMSEKIQGKLFIPTMLMFVGVLVVIIIPAMSGFSL